MPMLRPRHFEMKSKKIIVKDQKLEQQHWTSNHSFQIKHDHNKSKIITHLQLTIVDFRLLFAIVSVAIDLYLTFWNSTNFVDEANFECWVEV